MPKGTEMQRTKTDLAFLNEQAEEMAMPCISMQG